MADSDSMREISPGKDRVIISREASACACVRNTENTRQTISLGGCVPSSPLPVSRASGRFVPRRILIRFKSAKSPRSIYNLTRPREILDILAVPVPRFEPLREPLQGVSWATTVTPKPR